MKNMIEYFMEISQGKDIRQNLISLKSAMKEALKEGSHSLAALLNHIGNNNTVLTALLKDNDAKVRKNAALVLGLLGQQDSIGQIMDAYCMESQRFVKSAYLEALKGLDYHTFLPMLKEQLSILENQELTDENRKHIREELSLLTELIRGCEGTKKHLFTGYGASSELILITNRNHREATKAYLNGIPHKDTKAGVAVRTDRIRDVIALRTVQEFLFVVDGVRKCEKDIDKAAQTMVDGGLLDFLRQRHDGEAPFYFRLDVKSKDIPDKATYVKHLGARIAEYSGRKLINSPSDYEIVIRLIEGKDGDFHVLVKLMTLPDQRFSYRRHTIAASIKPYLAALAVELAKEYLVEDAAVLDPFCGVGTMLAEREKQCHAKVYYGLDLFGEAIDKAKINLGEVSPKLNVYLIKRDFFGFTHKHTFDEVITNMPFTTADRDQPIIEGIYAKFFTEVLEHLKQGGILIMYSHDRAFVRKYAGKKPFHIEKELEISMKEGTYVFVVKRE